MDNIREVCSILDFQPNKLIEFGAAHPKTQRLGHFIQNGFDVTLIEANPRLYYCLTEGYNEDDFQSTWPNPPIGPYQNVGFKNFKNVKIENIAISNKTGRTKIYECNSSSFIEGVDSPAKINDSFNEAGKLFYEVNSRTISQIDDGNIDVLLADVEGAEWFCLDGLISRPKIIVLELAGQNYINPRLKEIEEWINGNGYRLALYDDTDFLFIKR